jgi:hypothetical protein
VIELHIAAGPGEFDRFQLGAECEPMEYTEKSVGTDDSNHLKEISSTDDELREDMRSEIGSFSDYSQGFVYRVTVTDCNGDEVESFGGFIGDQGAKGARDEGMIVAENSTSPERLIDLRIPESMLRRLITLVDGDYGDEADIRAVLNAPFATTEGTTSHG